jgi:hypothetical protein
MVVFTFSYDAECIVLLLRLVQVMDSFFTMVMKFWVPNSCHYFANIKDCSFAYELYFR